MSDISSVIPAPNATAPRVSVIMPVYNAERYLAEAIESVLAQSFGDFEFLIHDDGSTDGSLSIIQSYANSDARIRYTHGANKGASESANLLIENASSPLLARMDADDVSLPERLELQIEYMKKHPDCVAAGGAEIFMDSEGRPFLKNCLPLAHETIDSMNLRGVHAIQQGTTIFRKDALLECGCYNPEFLNAEDLDLWLRLAEIGHLANIPDIVLKYRIHGSSLSGSRREEQREMAHRACQAAWARRGLTGMSFDYGEWRMADTQESRRAFHLRYGWQAWKNGYRDTWLHYALHSVLDAPLSMKAWKLLVAGAIKRPDRSKGT